MSAILYVGLYDSCIIPRVLGIVARGRCRIPTGMIVYWVGGRFAAGDGIFFPRCLEEDL